MIRRTSLILTFIVIIIFGNMDKTYASSPLKYDECWSNLNKRILDDIKRSFPELTVLQNNKGHVTQYYYYDLHKAIIIEGRKTTHIKSLLPLFTGSSQGDRHLFIVSGEKTLSPKYDNSFVGYMLYKQIDGTNVMIKLRRSNSAWDVVSKRKIAGKGILPTKECLDGVGK